MFRSRKDKREPLFRRWRKSRFLGKWLLILALSALALNYIIVPAWWRVEGYFLARAFEREPTDERAMRLSELLDQRAFSRKRGGEVLRMIKTPRITVRDRYRVGLPVVVEARPWRSQSRAFSIKTSRSRTTWDGETKRGGTSHSWFRDNSWKGPYPESFLGFEGGGTRIHHVLMFEAASAGIYTETWTWSYRMFPAELTRRWGFKGPPESGYRKYRPWSYTYWPTQPEPGAYYECSFSESIVLDIRSATDADIVERIDGDDGGDLVAEIKRSITVATAAQNSTLTADKSLSPEHVMLNFSGAPVGLAFSIVLVTPDGIEHYCESAATTAKNIPLPCSSQSIPAGEARVFYLYLSRFGFDPGSLPTNFTVILRPDIEAAYFDVHNNRVFADELEIPVPMKGE